MGGLISTTRVTAYFSGVKSALFSKCSRETHDASDGQVAEPEVKAVTVVKLEDINIEENSSIKDIAEYCLPLIEVMFYGQTSAKDHQDEASITDVLNLGLYLSLLDKFLRQFENVEDFMGDEEEYRQILRLVAIKRCTEEEGHDQCHQRLLNESKRFVEIYHKRGVKSEELEHQAYWGCRQQLLSAKVIADWIEKETGPLDPLFGVLLNPTAGRVGPGDTGWFHNVLFDDTGYMAYHSAVHDAFGYLLTFHNTGPGYDYMDDSYFSTDNPLAGQLSGIQFWKKVVDEIETKEKVIKYLSI